MEPNQQQNYSIPIAIVIAGVIVAGAVLWSKGSGPVPVAQVQGQGQAQTASTAELIKSMPAVSAKDHVLGNPSAPITIVEYSDIECPFCRRFHTTMQEVMSQYGDSGQVAWVYRQFPLSIHPKAYPEATATECVASQYDNNTFWKFLAALMETKADADGNQIAVISDDFTAEQRIAEASTKLKLDGAKIALCVSADTFKQKLESLRGEAMKAGLGQNETGTPYSIIVAGNKRYFIDGAQPYSAVKALIDTALKG
ncbi:MAG: thioredoxin domain-containing protein [Candidatus Paceibacterota bacterium]|jgi:protein-disulfide isomerase